MRNTVVRKAAGIAGTLALAAGLGAATTTPAQASPSTCPYPYVCFYENGHKLGQFQDVTSHFQTLTTSQRATSVYNSRNDDVAYIRLSNGGTVCVPPKKTLALSPYVARATGIRISWSSTC